MNMLRVQIGNQDYKKSKRAGWCLIPCTLSKYLDGTDRRFCFAWAWLNAEGTVDMNDFSFSDLEEAYENASSYSIAAVETHYAGEIFASRLEARWCRFFTVLGLKWEYEPSYGVIDRIPAVWDNDLGKYVEDEDYVSTGYELLPDQKTINVMYCPDFYLPQFKMWVEIKPIDPVRDARYKARKWAIKQKQPVLILCQPLQVIGTESEANYLYDEKGICHNHVRWAVKDNVLMLDSDQKDAKSQSDPRLVLAFREARIIQFEHGG